MRTVQNSWRLSLLLALVVPILAACGGAPAAAPTTAPEAPAATEAPAAPAATEAPAAPEAPAATEAPAPTEAPEAAQPGGTLKILYWQAITILNPHQATGTKDFDGASVILEPLARFDENGALVPYLAAEIPTIENGGIAEDATSVTWKLKEGVKWSDGSDFTADDVIFTWQYCADEATACTTKSYFDPIASVEAVSPTEVKITWKEPNADPFISFTSFNGMILQKAQFENCVGENAISDAACQAANLKPIGTGAWQVKDFMPGDVVVYERNANYRDAANVFFDEVEIKGGGDATTAARAVCETGEVDFAWNLQVQKAVLEPILAAGQCDPVVSGSFGIERVVLNFANPDPALGEKRAEPDQPHWAFSDLKVRQAVAKAIDRAAIAEQLYGPTGSVTCNILTQPVEYASTNLTCERDVEGAKALLDEAGWVVPEGSSIREKDGKKLVLSFSTSINPLRQGEQAIIKANLAEVGIQVDLKAIDAGVFFGGDPGNPDTLNKMYVDMQMYTNSNTNPDPTGYFDGWSCANVNSAANQWQGGNDGRYCSEEYDAALAQLKTTLDPEQRIELFIQLNDILVNDGAVIPLIDRTTPQGKSKALNGPTGSTFDSQLWNIATWSK
ncbi:MAG: hypothetical protein RLZZ387_2021 [Chloroflexota bacterium]|jgi:peptide/nickel transport system substrate-binding protein